MNKLLKVFLYFLGFVIILWVIGRATNAFQYFNAPSSSNEPGIMKGDRFFASNLVKPKRLNFICFNTETPEFGKSIWVFRLCVLGGDVVEIRKGHLFVNNDPVDKKLSLIHAYYLPIDEYERIKDSISIDEDWLPDLTKDSVMLLLEDSYVKRNKVIAVPLLDPINQEDPWISKAFSKNWNRDNFGPITVPADKYFVLGDNRHNAQDSRYIGFVEKKDYVATVLWK